MKENKVKNMTLPTGRVNSKRGAGGDSENEELVRVARRIKYASDSIMLPSSYETATFKTKLLKRLNERWAGRTNEAGRGGARLRRDEMAERPAEEQLAGVQTINRPSRFAVLFPAIVVAVIVALVGWLVVMRIGSGPELQTVASVQVDRGVVVVDSGDGWRNVGQLTDLHVGDAIRTDQGGRASVVFENGDVIRLDQKTTVEINGVDENNVLVAQKEGRTYSRAVERGDDYTVMANGVRFKADGTAFGVEAEEAEARVLDIESEVGAFADAREILLMEQGDYYRFFGAGEFEELGVDKAAMEVDDWWLWNLERDRELGVALGILGDFERPLLVIDSPADKEVTTAEKIKVVGYAETGAELEVNGAAVENREGKFEVEVDLTLGENEIRAEAVDRNKNRSEAAVAVKREEPTDSGTDPGAGEVLGDQATVCNPGVTLNAIASGEGQAAFSWTKSCEQNIYYKLVASKKTTKPTYPNDVVWATGDWNTTSATVNFDPGNWYVRVAVVRKSDGAVFYSNTEWFTLTVDKTIILKEPEILSYGVKFRWTASKDPYFAKYVLIATKEADEPGYPGDIIWTGTARNTISITKHLSPGVWRVRMAIVRNDGGVYLSNKVTVDLGPVLPPF